MLVPSATVVASEHTNPDDSAAIRRLWRAYAATCFLRVLQDPARQPDAIHIAPDRKSATGEFHCLAHIAEPIAGHGSLIEMARLQGNREARWEHGVHELECVNTPQGWQIQRAVYRPSARGIVTFEPSSPV